VTKIEVKVKKLAKEAQCLADDAQNITDRISELGAEDAISTEAIQEDIAQFCFGYAKLRVELEVVKNNIKENNEKIRNYT